MPKLLTILSLPLLAYTTPAAPVTGWASYYEEAPTVATIKARLEMGHITAADLLWANSLIAVADCGMIGERVTIQVDGGEMRNAVVFDCAGNDGTIEWMQESDVVLELDYYTAQAYDMVNRGALRVSMWE